MTNSNGAATSGLWRDPALAVQCGCTALVALGAAYASYRHGRDFAVRFGADHTTAAIWPLIVDGLLMIATVELWKPTREQAGGRWAAWVAFAFGISLSLCANIGSAPELNILGVTVAACPPLALLLAVELLNRALKRHRAVATEQMSEPVEVQSSRGADAIQDGSTTSPTPTVEVTAEERMWTYYLAAQEDGRTPTGAELDRAAGTHNYGRRILRKWRDEGLLRNTVPRRPSSEKPGGELQTSSNAM
ncbi:DUF2637 domain-containing protein [Amycolatopsis keratiniphila]|uniref:DUF2637 domain-containing protein n=1 Tax=Amycolatopsis keratiniphila subsp. keratiniphila TaxID=227715 RepID=A0A1W2M3E1_9PSEU|nr:DUF2637 domain-containing protein [Amycolatopsis keratiniphila]ONF74500.1 hypothetical protein AVR91_0203435 [Amycolatopsis keratiniphila subsp. keratiniphila]